MIIPLMKKKQWTKYDNIFMIKKFSEKQEKRNFLFDKEHLKKKKHYNYTNNIIFNGKRLNDFCPKTRNNTEFCLYHCYSTQDLKV